MRGFGTALIVPVDVTFQGDHDRLVRPARCPRFPFVGLFEKSEHDLDLDAAATVQREYQAFQAVGN